MAEQENLHKKKQRQRKRNFAAQSSGFKHRFVAWLLNRLGLIETRRKAKVAAGDQNWRIIRYLRIARPVEQPYPLLPTSYVSPEVFEKHMVYLVKHCHPLSLDALVTSLEAGQPVPERAVVTVFDEGWRDSFHFAFPILKNLRIPATIFLPTAFIGTMNLFWRDKIIASMLLLEQGGVKFPPLPTIEQVIGESVGGEAAFDLGYSMARIIHLLEYLETASVAERELVLMTLGMGVEGLGGIPTDRLFLSWEEVLTMKNDGIQFGSNGHTHSLLSELTSEGIGNDLDESLRRLQEHGINTVPVFSFPEGRISREARSLLYERGLRYGLAEGSYSRGVKGKSITNILGCTTMFESVSYNVDMFACRLWGVGGFGESY